jgi:hypothetical protein
VILVLAIYTKLHRYFSLFLGYISTTTPLCFGVGILVKICNLSILWLCFRIHYSLMSLLASKYHYTSNNLGPAIPGLVFVMDSLVYLITACHYAQSINIYETHDRITSIPACRKTLRAEKNNKYFDLKHLSISYFFISYVP